MTADAGLFDAVFELAGAEDKFSTPLKMATALDPNYKETAYLKLLERKCLPAFYERHKRIIISLPPGVGKSDYVQWLEAWCVVKDAEYRILNVSYSEDKAVTAGRKVRARVEAAGCRLSREQASVTDWKREDSVNGFLKSLGIGGGLVGNHANLIVLDDPVKGMRKALSLAEREALWQSYATEINTRLLSGGSIILIMTRWHDDDLAGRLITRDGTTENGGIWDVVNIPAQCVDEQSDPLGRKEGEFLLGVKDQSDWEMTKRTTPSRDWNANFQGDPVPTDGAVMQSDWLIGYARHHAPLANEGAWLTSWDLAFSGHNTSDYVVGQVWCRKQGKFYLVDQVRGQWDFPTTLEKFKDLLKKYPHITRHVIEEKANGTALRDTMRRKNIHTIGFNPGTDKIARVNAVSALMEGGDVLIPDWEPWTIDILQEVARFPYGRNDDTVDAMVQALMYYTGKRRTKGKSRGSVVRGA